MNITANERTVFQCAASGCDGCIVCDPKELNEWRACFDCGKQFIPPPYESQKNSRCCPTCAELA